MTVETLYKWAKKNNVENLPVGIQFMGATSGETEGNSYESNNVVECDIKTINGKVVVILS